MYTISIYMFLHFFSNSKVEGKKHYLTIKDAKMDDAGAYSITVDEAQSKGKLTVKG